SAWTCFKADNEVRAAVPLKSKYWSIHNVFRVHLITTGAVLYRIPLTWGQNKLPWKLLHAAMMLLSLILAVVGLCAVFDVHNAQKTANLYSLHSWIGIFSCLMSLLSVQWLLGFAGFLLPCSPVALRQLLKPVHVWLGSSILMLSVAACISGINEKLFFVLQPYSSLPAEAVLANSLGALIVAFGLVVLMILSNGKWQRADPGPEDLTYTVRRKFPGSVLTQDSVLPLLYLYEFPR
uniref:Lysosomal membrane ascorbate-dependent ferrireductase CYB561A3 n=1 Tax=Nothobranchius furzeri TaxID=105023 RepID=A0A8C6NSS5_NOTFU